MCYSIFLSRVFGVLVYRSCTYIVKFILNHLLSLMQLCDFNFYGIIFKHFKRGRQDTIGFTFCLCILWSWWTDLFLETFIDSVGFFFFVYLENINKELLLIFPSSNAAFCLGLSYYLRSLVTGWTKYIEDESSSLIHNFKHNLVFYQ